MVNICYTFCIMELKQLYRVQDAEKFPKPYLNTQCPVRRVIVGPSGEILFNPDNKHFVYFSRTKEHHAYYIYNKTFKIIKKEVENAKKDSGLSKFDVSAEFICPSHIDFNMLKKINNLFKNYLPPKNIELVSLEYLKSFGNLFEASATHNNKKDFGKNYPEFADPSTYGGAYGVNTEWLNLLKYCTVATKNSVLPVNRVLEFLLETGHAMIIHKRRFKLIFSSNQELLTLLDKVPSERVMNPAFLNKNAPNEIVSALSSIEENKMYSPKKSFDSHFFSRQRKAFKEEYHEIIQEL